MATMYRATSLALYGHQDADLYLRLITAMEMIGECGAGNVFAGEAKFGLCLSAALCIVAKRCKKGT